MKNEKPVVIDFWAEWCHPCKMMAPAFEAASKKFPEAVFAKLNVDENMDVSSSLGVMSIPTFKVFKNGKEVGEIIGAHNPEKFIQKIEAILK